MGSREMGRHWSTKEEREISTMREKQGLKEEISKMRPTCKSHSDDKVAKGICCQKKDQRVIKDLNQLTLKHMFRRQFASGSKSPAWTRKEGKSESGGLNRKGVASYRAANPGSKLKTAVTTKPSKLKSGSKAAKRRKSFCARMKGMKKRLTSAKTARDPERINKSLRKWNC